MNSVNGNHSLRLGIAGLFRLWLIFLCVLFLLAPTDIPITNRIIGVTALFFSFWIVFLKNAGLHSSQVEIYRVPRISEQRQLFLLLVQLALTSVGVAFYTGTNLVSGLFDSLRGLNTYSAYQSFFRDSGIAGTGFLSRIHIIVSMAVGKLIFVIITANFFLSTARRTFVSISIFASSLLIYLSFGLSRGTFFEVFEISVAVGYFGYISKKPREFQRRILLTKFTKILIAISLPILFIVNTMRRFDDRETYFERLCSSNFCFRPYNIEISSEYFVYIFANYFANGPYSVSVFFENILEGKNLEYLLPMWGYWGADLEEAGVRGLLCGQYLNCRFVWMPDIVLFLSVFGIFSFLFSNLFLYWTVKNEKRMMMTQKHSGHAVNFYLFLFIISLPVGNFLTISSSNILGLMIAILMARFRFGPAKTHKEVFS